MGFELLSRRGETAVIKSSIGQTNAMGTIRKHEGYITGPFQIRDGSERWSVGFDTDTAADAALSDLSTRTDFKVETRSTTSFEKYLDVIQHIDAAKRVPRWVPRAVRNRAPDARDGRRGRVHSNAPRCDTRNAD